MNITLHSKNLCVQCDATKRALKKAFIKLFKELDIGFDERVIDTGGSVYTGDEENSAAIMVVDLVTGTDAETANDSIKKPGQPMQAPVVITDERQWAGFVPDEIKYFMTDAANAMAKGRTITIKIYQAPAIPSPSSLSLVSA